MSNSYIDSLWLLICAAMVFFMQVGFLSLEAGLTRSKNSINVAIKNVTDFGISFLLYWLMGFAVMYGSSLGGWIGSTDFWVTFNSEQPYRTCFFLYQAMFCGAAVTIIGGAVAERVRFLGYIIITIVVSIAIYPVFGHWAWGGGFEGLRGWLYTLGFRDFAGSTVVHSVGGWAALAVLIVIGPRRGRFLDNGIVQKIPGCNLPVAMQGVLFLWVGWIGFNGGSALQFNEHVPHIIVNTMLAAGAGMIASLFFGWLYYKYPNPLLVMNGSLAGLVSITANCYAVTSANAILIGSIGGFIMILGNEVLERLRIDDVVGAVPVHAFSGVWGTVALAIFGNLEIVGTGLSRSSQLYMQLFGAVVCFIISFGLTFVLCSMINRIFSLRVSADAEHTGLNVAEHKATTEILDVLVAMKSQAKKGDVHTRLPVEPFTEIGQIATHFNRVMDSLQKALVKTDTIVNNAREGIITFFKDSLAISSINPCAMTMFGYVRQDILGTPISNILELPRNGNEIILPEGESRNSFDIKGKRLDGSTFPIACSISLAKFDNSDAYIGIFRDISQIKKGRTRNQ